MSKSHEADAKTLDLYIGPFEKLNGKTPLLEEFLERALKDAEDSG